MAYEKYYENNWQNNAEGATPITAAALNHMEDGIVDLDEQVSDLNSKNIKFKEYKFENLAQYTNQGYYLQISNVRAKASMPTNAQVVSASLTGWASVGQYPNIQLVGNDSIYVFYPPNSTITNASYVTVRFAYI